MPVDAFPDKLVKVAIHGASIATLLYTVTAGGAPCDGLLFGDTVTTTTQHLRDDDDMASVTESSALISAALCCASTCSFYDEAGDLSESSLDELVGQRPGPLLGWLSFRPSASGIGTGGSSAMGTSSSSASSLSLRPSMRETAVTAALLRRGLLRDGGRQAVLLLLVTRGSDHNGATVTWQYRCFQARQAASSGEVLMEPVPTVALNLGGHMGHHAYQELAAATALAPGPLTSSHAGSSAAAAGGSSTFSSISNAGTFGGQLSYAPHPVRVTFASTASRAPSQQQQQSQQPSAAAATGGASAGGPAAMGAMAAGARAQVAAVKQHCESLLAGLHDLCGHAVAGEAAVEALRSRRDALMAQLARSQ